MRAWVLASSIVVACGGPQPADPVPTAVTPDAGAAVAVIAPDAAPPPPPPRDAAPPPDAAPTPTFTIPSGPRPAVKGKAIEIVEEQEVMVTGGLKVKFDYASHKHGANLGMWGFVVTKGGKQEELELRSDDPGGWQAEVGVFGKLLVFTHVSYTEFTVTAVAGKLPALLDPEAALQKIEDAATSAGLPLGDATGYSDDNGIGHVRTTEDGRTLWNGYIGLYTRRVWFTE